LAMFDQLRRAWNAFRDDDRYVSEVSPGPSYSVKPDRARLRSYPDRSIVTSIITKIAVDVSDVVIRHTKVDDLDRFTAMVESTLFDSSPTWIRDLVSSVRTSLPRSSTRESPRSFRST
jgi:hypothetical protein